MDAGRATSATVAIAGVIGGFASLVLAITLIAAPTGIAPTSGCGPTRITQDAGFDPWTGQPRPRIIHGDCMGHIYDTVEPIPNELLGRTGLPWGSFVVIAGVLVGLAGGWLASRFWRDTA